MLKIFKQILEFAGTRKELLKKIAVFYLCRRNIRCPSIRCIIFCSYGSPKRKPFLYECMAGYSSDGCIYCGQSCYGIYLYYAAN